MVSLLALNRLHNIMLGSNLPFQASNGFIAFIRGRFNENNFWIVPKWNWKGYLIQYLIYPFLNRKVSFLWLLHTVLMWSHVTQRKTKEILPKPSEKEENCQRESLIPILIEILFIIIIQISSNFYFRLN